MMLLDIDHAAIAAETSYRLERDSHSSTGRRNPAEHSAVRAAVRRLWALSDRNGGDAGRPAAVRHTPTAISHRAAH